MIRSIAVIGSGMAGLTAAYRCRKAGYAVTVFEALPRRGMDAHSMSVQGGVVDVPLRVMSASGWKHVLRLADEVGVDTFSVDTLISCSDSDRNTWFRSARVPLADWHFVGSLRALNLKTVRVGLGMLDLSGRLRSLNQAHSDMSLAELLALSPPDPLFWRGLVLPILITICTCDEKHLLAWPARQLLSLLDDLSSGDRMLRLTGGTAALVTALGRDQDFISGSPVQRVVEASGGVDVHNARGEGGTFDRAIVATQANQLDFLGDAKHRRERTQLKKVEYADGELIVHTDERFMPQQARDWTALNFQTSADLGHAMFTVWMNAVEPTLARGSPLFQSWNPLYPPKAGKVLSRVPLQRAVVNGQTAGMLRALARWHRQPQRRIFYCGSWAYEGVPLLETAVRSAEAVVEIIRRQDVTVAS